ncbi:MAG: hypothetical protein RIE52_00785 [Balneola sp.]
MPEVWIVIESEFIITIRIPALPMPQAGFEGMTLKVLQIRRHPEFISGSLYGLVVGNLVNS